MFICEWFISSLYLYLIQCHVYVKPIHIDQRTLTLLNENIWLLFHTSIEMRFSSRLLSRKVTSSDWYFTIPFKSEFKHNMYIQVGKITFKCVALLTMLWMCVTPSQLPVEVMTDITIGTLQHYHSTCVYMLRQTQEPGQCEINCVRYQSLPTLYL
jgi:hypothetical protein